MSERVSGASARAGQGCGPTASRGWGAGVRCCVLTHPACSPPTLLPRTPPTPTLFTCRTSRSRLRLIALYLRSSVSGGKHGQLDEMSVRWQRCCSPGPACSSPTATTLGARLGSTIQAHTRTLRRQLSQLLLEQLQLAQLRGLGHPQVLHLQSGKRESRQMEGLDSRECVRTGRGQTEGVDSPLPLLPQQPPTYLVVQGEVLHGGGHVLARPRLQAHHAQPCQRDALLRQRGRRVGWCESLVAGRVDSWSAWCSQVQACRRPGLRLSSYSPLSACSS